MKIFILFALVLPFCCAGTVVGVNQLDDNKQQHQVHVQQQQQQQHVVHQVHPQQPQPNWHEYESPNADKGVVTHVTLHHTPTRSSDSVQYQPSKPHYGVQVSQVGPLQEPQVGVHVSHIAGNEQAVEHVSHQYVSPVYPQPQNYHVQEQYSPHQSSSGVVAVQYVPQQAKPPVGQAVHLVSVPLVQHQVKHVDHIPSHEQQGNVVSHIVVPLSGHGGVFGVHAEPVGQPAHVYPSHVALGGQQYPQGVSQVAPQSGHYVVQHPAGVPVNRKASEEVPEVSYESQEHYVPQVPHVPVVSHVAILGHITSATSPHYQPQQYLVPHHQPHQHQQQQHQHQHQQQPQHHHQQQQQQHQHQHQQPLQVVDQQNKQN